MCSHYQAIRNRQALQRHFGAAGETPQAKDDVWPGYPAPFIRRHPHADVGDEAVPEAELLTGLFGLVPHWATDSKITRSTYNCRSESAAEKPSFRDAWRRKQRCIIPAEALYEPDWRSGKAVPTRILHADGLPLGVAGLWSHWRSPKGDMVYSFTMLTLNAQAHPLMNQFHKPADEKRMVAILRPEQYAGWLRGEGDTQDYLQLFGADSLETMAPEPMNSQFQNLCTLPAALL